ncbi:MAG TPA: hypothetical protein VFN72_02975 [Solirubrobacterales bacterium]|nr:hypothetical protein [Solirubrobacterales bacterium]
MAEIVFATPIPRAKQDLDRQTMAEIEGPRRDEYAAALKEAGITRQAIWHQETPSGDILAIVYIEATDADAPLRFISLDTEISKWFSQQMRDGYGRYVSGPPLPVELVSDVRV